LKWILGFLPWFQGGCWFTQGVYIGVLGIHILLEHKWKQKLPKRGKKEKKAKEFQICHNEL